MNPHPFDVLTPDFLIQAIEAQGFWCDGRILALNSYENRVYQIGIEDEQPLIAKFYRPERWSREQILEEHAFCFELADQELPVVAPMLNDDGDSLLQHENFHIALFKRRGGRAPELDYQDNLTVLGRLLARMHLIGARDNYRHRPDINIDSYGVESAEYISEYFIPAELVTAYETLVRDLLSLMRDILDRTGPVTTLRVHGDCHAGNMLWRDNAPHFVDFDDSRMAPAIQDIWMLLSGDRNQQSRQLDKILQGYLEFNDFNYTELQLIEVLRTLRIMYFAAWLARRWQDPAFPQAFPWFNTVRYWEEHVLELREQLAALHEAPIMPAA